MVIPSNGTRILYVGMYLTDTSSREAAEELYAVILKGDDLQVDMEATAKRRQTLAG